MNMYLWCYLNGYILADQNGIIKYMFGQSSLSFAMLHGPDTRPKKGLGSGERPKKGLIISVAL
jgi:hypothetical protein